MEIDSISDPESFFPHGEDFSKDTEESYAIVGAAIPLDSFKLRCCCYFLRSHSFLWVGWAPFNLIYSFILYPVYPSLLSLD